MKKFPTESPVRYLASRLGKVNEALKRAYLCGKRIFVVESCDLDFVKELLARESILPIEMAVTTTIEGTLTTEGYDSVVYVDDRTDYIPSELTRLSRIKPTIYVHSNGKVSSTALLNFARHLSALSGFRDLSTPLALEALRKSIIVIVAPDGMPDYKTDVPGLAEPVGIPPMAEVLTERIKVPLLSQEELGDIISRWLYDKEDMPIRPNDKGFMTISDEHYINRMYQSMRTLTPREIVATLENCRLLYGKVYRKPDDKVFEKLLKTVRSVSERAIMRSKALSLIDSSGAGCPDGLQAVVGWLAANKDRIIRPEHYVGLGMEPPKGLLMSGIPGSGKSMLAKYIASQLGLSLVRLDLGDAMGGYVGDSEKGFKTALEVAETLSPCVVWIDEMEKMFEGGHEVTRRLIGKFLTWMQEKAERGVSCFVYATANDISKMPPEMFRSGRFDEKFFTFMPSAADCAAIFDSIIKHQATKYAEENPEAIRPLFNIAKINGKMFMELLNGNVCLPSKIHENWSGQIPNSNKFFIGSDIAQLIISAKAMYCEKQRRQNSGDAEFDSAEFKQCLIAAINSRKTYGETNLYEVAAAFAMIARNNFVAASKHIVMPLEGYNEVYYRQAFIKDRNTTARIYTAPGKHYDNEYDRQLFLVVSQYLNSIAVDIIDKHK